VCANWPWLAGAKPTDEALIVIDRADDDNRLAGIVLRPSDVDLTVSIRSRGGQNKEKRENWAE
jgi:hypothetical protein